jgi:hypothetical protein
MVASISPSSSSWDKDFQLYYWLWQLASEEESGGFTMRFWRFHRAFYPGDGV